MLPLAGGQGTSFQFLFPLKDCRVGMQLGGPSSYCIGIHTPTLRARGPPSLLKQSLVYTCQHLSVSSVATSVSPARTHPEMGTRMLQVPETRPALGMPHAADWLITEPRSASPMSGYRFRGPPPPAGYQPMALGLGHPGELGKHRECPALPGASSCPHESTRRWKCFGFMMWRGH